MNEYKSISAGQLYQNLWKNPLTDIPKDKEREQNCSKSFNPQRSYDTVYRQPSINHEHILQKNLLADITKGTEREQIYSKIVNPKSSYDTVYRESSINHQHLFSPVQFENKMERVQSVDAWIEELSPYETQLLSRNATNQEITLAWLLQQNLPRIEIPTFNGSLLKWVEFVTKFKETVHNHVYLNNSRKLHYLQQHVSGIAKTAILGFSNDERGYILSLKRLKYKFGEKSRIAETHLTKVTKGKQIANDNDKGLIEFCYSLSDCVITLRQLNYKSDIYSTDTLRQTIRRLPNKFYARWGEHCLSLRRVREPTLLDMEAWLHDRIEASTDPYLPPKLPKQNQHHPKQDYKCNSNTGVHIVIQIRGYIPQESTQRKKANLLKKNVYFVKKNI